MARAKKSQRGLLASINPVVFDVGIPGFLVAVFTTCILCTDFLPEGYWRMVTSRPLWSAVQNNTIQFTESYGSIEPSMQFFKMTFRFAYIEKPVRNFNISFWMESRASNTIIARRRERHTFQRTYPETHNSTNYNLFCDRLLPYERIDVKGQVNCTKYPSKGVFILEVVYLNPSFRVFLMVLHIVLCSIFFFFSLVNAVVLASTPLGRRLVVLGFCICAVDLPFVARQAVMTMKQIQYFDILSQNLCVCLIFYITLSIYQELRSDFNTVINAVYTLLCFVGMAVIEVRCMASCITRHRDYYDEIRPIRRTPAGLLYVGLLGLFVYNAVTIYRRVKYHSNYDFWFLTAVSAWILVCMIPNFVFGGPTDFKQSVLYLPLFTFCAFWILIFIERRSSSWFARRRRVKRQKARELLNEGVAF